MDVFEHTVQCRRCISGISHARRLHRKGVLHLRKCEHLRVLGDRCPGRISLSPSRDGYRAALLQWTPLHDSHTGRDAQEATPLLWDCVGESSERGSGIRLPSDWSRTQQYHVRNGNAYVMWTSASWAVDALKQYDPQRYAALNWPYNPDRERHRVVRRYYLRHCRTTGASAEGERLRQPPSQVRRRACV